MATQWIEVDWGGRTVRIEHLWINAEAADRPLIIFLHEGLGSVSMWRDFPQRLCDAVGACGLVYSRPGYGKSTTHEPDLPPDPRFMHRQAQEVLPALLKALGITAATRRPWLFGHSDGGTIALLYAAAHPGEVSGIIVMAPHIMVEDVTVASIAAASAAYRQTDLRERLARHHDDPDSTFLEWSRVWLHPDFRAWSIDAELHMLRCPVLAIQGHDDEYGSLAQIRGIASRVPQTRLLELPNCRHSPHRDQPDQVLQAVVSFMQLPPSGPVNGADTALPQVP